MKRVTIVLCFLLVFSLPALFSTGQQEAMEDGGKEAVHLTVWSYPRFKMVDASGEEMESGSFERMIIAEFTAEHPEVTVDLEMIPYSGGPEKVKTAIAGRNPPDVLVDYIGRIAEYAFMDALVPLDDMLAQEDKADIPASILSLCSINGRLIMYPWGSMPIAWVVNKALFQKAGAVDLLPLDTPDRMWTIAEAEKAMRAVSELEGVYAGALWAKDEQADSTMRILIQNFGADIYSGDYSKVVFDSPEAVEGLQWLLDLTDEGVLAPGAESAAFADTFSLFTSGKTAIMPLGTLSIYNYLKNMVAKGELTKDQMDPAILAPPYKSGTQLKTDVQAHGICIFDNGDERVIGTGKLLIEKMAKGYQKEGNLYAGSFPVRKSAGNIFEDPEISVLTTMVSYATETGLKAPYYGEMRAFFYPQFQAALIKSKTAEQALQDFVTMTNNMLESKQ